jgi:hypothetical protein
MWLHTNKKNALGLHLVKWCAHAIYPYNNLVLMKQIEIRLNFGQEPQVFETERGLTLH